MIEASTHSKPLAILTSMALPLLLAGCSGAPDEVSRAPFESGAVVDENDARYQTTSLTLASDDRATAGKLDRRVALIIGNSDYGSDIGRLKNPTNDALDMAEALRNTGFEVQLLTNVSREEMMRAVLAFDSKLRGSDVGLFYYAGHAVQVNGRNFLIPTSANLDISSSQEDTIADYVALETVDINNVLGRMGNAETDLSIVILDACRNNPFSQGSRSLSRGLAQTSAPRGTFVAYATAPGKIAQDGEGENSPYTAAIVDALEVPGLKLEEVFKKVRQDVALQTSGKQIPWENSSVFGDFYFTEPVETAPPKPVLTEDEYREVQILLARLGFYRGSINGVPDEKTREAVIQWQTLHGLDLDGEIVRAYIPFLRTDAARVDAAKRPKFDEAAEEPVNVGLSKDPVNVTPTEKQGIKKLPDEPLSVKIPDQPVDEPFRVDPPKTTRPDRPLVKKPPRKPVPVEKAKEEPIEDKGRSAPSDRWSDFVIPPPPA